MRAPSQFSESFHQRGKWSISCGSTFESSKARARCSLDFQSSLRDFFHLANGNPRLRLGLHSRRASGAEHTRSSQEGARGSSMASGDVKLEQWIRVRPETGRGRRFGHGLFGTPSSALHRCRWPQRDLQMANARECMGPGRSGSAPSRCRRR